MLQKIKFRSNTEVLSEYLTIRWKKNDSKKWGALLWAAPRILLKSWKWGSYSSADVNGNVISIRKATNNHFSLLKTWIEILWLTYVKIRTIQFFEDGMVSRILAYSHKLRVSYLRFCCCKFCSIVTYDLDRSSLSTINRINTSIHLVKWSIMVKMYCHSIQWADH